MELIIEHSKESFGTINQVYFDEKNAFGILYHHGGVYTELAEKLYRDLMIFTNDNLIRSYFLDIRGLNGTFTNLASFFKNEFTPHLKERGWERTGGVFGSNPFVKFAVNTLMKLAFSDVEMRIFTSPLDILKWISMKHEIDWRSVDFPEQISGLESIR